jgi:general secretion pathway protein D
MHSFRVLRATIAALLTVLLAAPPVEARTRKGDKFYKQAQTEEQKKLWEKALDLYEKALAEDPSDPAYQMGARRVRFQAAQARVDFGQKLRNEGRLAEALAEFQRAYAIDPASTIAEQELRRTYQMIEREKKKAAQPEGQAAAPEEQGLTPAQIAKKELEERITRYAGAPELKPITPQIQGLKMNNQPPRVLFETVAKLAGVNVVFDPDYLSQTQGRNFSLDLSNTTLEQALDYLAILTKSYWKPLSANTILITQDSVQKRRDFEDQVVKVFYLQNVNTIQELQEIATTVRGVVEARRLFTYNAQNAILVRGTTDQVALVEKLINDLDKPKSEVVIDVFVMEANRAKTRDLAAALVSGGTVGGLRLPINFTPRNPVLSGNDDDDDGDGDGNGNNNGNNQNPNLGNLGGTTGTPTEQAISLAQVRRISTNDFSISLPGALLQAMLSDRSTRVLQNPQVRAVDNQKADLHIGDKYPYATGSFQPGFGGAVGVGVSPLVSTQFQFADVGVKVSIVPKVHGSDEVSLHVEMEVSSVRDRIDVGGLSQPVIGQRRVVHDIRVKEGEVSLIGGLVQNQDTNSYSGIPGIGNVPILKHLLGSSNTERNQGELMIALVPHIVRSPELTENNLRGIAAGNDQNIRITTYSAAATPAQTPAGQPPATPQPETPATPEPATPAPPKTAPEAPKPVAGPLKLAITPAAAEVKLGSTITLTVAVENATDLFTAPLRVKFDPKLLRLNDVQRGTLLSGDGQNVIFTRNIQNDVGEASVVLNRLPGSSGISGAGSLVTLVFQAIAPGAASVAVVDANLRNSQMQPLAVALPEAAIAIK